MEIVSKKISEIKPYDRNPRKNDEAVQYVANSIKEFGFKVPIVIDKNGIIVAGHTRYRASKQLGMKEVPCIIADDLTDEQVKAFRLADNKVAEYSLWDYEKLSKELEELNEKFNFEDFGFDTEDYVFNTLEETGLMKNKIDKQSFTITFSINNEHKPLFDNYVYRNSKKDVDYIFLKKIEEIDTNGN